MTTPGAVLVRGTRFTEIEYYSVAPSGWEEKLQPSEELIRKYGAAVPGDSFGDDACVRFSYASKTERIREGVRRLREWIARK